VEVAWSDVDGLDPDRLLLVPCGYALEQARDDAARARERLHALAPCAVERGDAALGHSAYFSRSGPRVVSGIEALAAWLHPGSVPAEKTEGILEGWR
jgi:iron complex transport system substrate-binding protein